MKCAENTESWVLFDIMRGIVSGGNDFFVEPNDNGAENTFQNWIELTSTGFKIITGNYQINQNNKTYIFTCIRRPDGYVGKPTEAGTDVLTMTPGTSGAPLYPSPNHIVDFALQKSNYASGSAADWSAASRLTQGFRLETNTADLEVANSFQVL